jgi:hypothetical protein
VVLTNINAAARNATLQDALRKIRGVQIRWVM